MLFKARVREGQKVLQWSLASTSMTEVGWPTSPENYVRRFRQSGKTYLGFSWFPKNRKEKAACATVPSSSRYQLPRAPFGGSYATLMLKRLWEKSAAVCDWEILRELFVRFILNPEPHASGAMVLPLYDSSSPVKEF